MNSGQKGNGQKNISVQGANQTEVSNQSLANPSQNQQRQSITAIDNTTIANDCQAENGKNCGISENNLSVQGDASQCVSTNTVESVKKVSQTIESEDEQAYDVVTIATKEYPTYEKFLKEQSENIYCVIKDVATDWVKDCSVRYGYGVTDFIPDFYSEARQYLTGKKLESIILQWQQPKSLEGKYGVPYIHLRLTYIRHHDPHTTKSFDQDCANITHDMFEQWKAANAQNLAITVETYRQYKHAFECKKTPEQLAEEKRQRELAEAKQNAARLKKYQYWHECFEHGFADVSIPANGYFVEKFLSRVYGMKIDSIRYCTDTQGVFLGKYCFQNEDGTIKKSYPVIICKLSSFDGEMPAYQVLLHDKEDIERAKATKDDQGDTLATKKTYIHPDYSKCGAFIPITPMPPIAQLSKNHVFCTSEGLASILSPYLIMEKSQADNGQNSLEFQGIFSPENPNDTTFHFMAGLDCHNLPHVWREIREHYGNDCIIINLADDDCLDTEINGVGDTVPKRNSGKETAQKGIAYDVISIFPEFAKCGMNFETRVKYHAKDFNDLHRYCALSFVIPSILESLKIAIEANKQRKIAALQQAATETPAHEPTPTTQANEPTTTQQANEPTTTQQQIQQLESTEKDIADEIQADDASLIPPFEEKSLAEFSQEIINICAKSVILGIAPTGAGKSYIIARDTLELLVRGKFSLVILPTIKNARQGIKYAKSCLKKHPDKYPGITEKDIGLVISGRDCEARTNNLSRKIIFTTYGYVGRFGDQPQGILAFHEMIESRIVFFDEMQTLENICCVQYPLVARYVHNQDDYEHVPYCPKTGKNGSCKDCIQAYYKRMPRKPNQEREYPKSFPATQDFMAYHQDIRTAPIDFGINQDGSLAPTEKKDVLNKLLEYSGEYICIHGTLFFCGFPSNAQDIDYVPDGKCTDQEFVWNLRKTLVNPHIRTEFPIIKKLGKPISSKEIVEGLKEGTIKESDIQFPKLPCECPKLCGFDAFPFYQLMGMDVPICIDGEKTIKRFEGAKALVFVSATPSQIVMDHIHILEGKNHPNPQKRNRFNPVRIIRCKDIPYRFKVTVLSEHKGFSVDKQRRIVERILDQNHPLPVKTFIVTGKQDEFEALRKSLRGSDFEANITYFEDGKYKDEQQPDCQESPENRKITMQITYCKSALCVGSNLPQYQLMILDCRQFIPLSALEGLKTGMSDQQIKMVTANDLKKKITQCCGRILRSLIERTDETQVTIEDTKQLVILLHGLPEGIEFDLDQSLLIPNTYQHIKGTWLVTAKNDKKENLDQFCDSVMDSIQKALAGQPLTNYTDATAKKNASKPTNQQSHSQRELANTPAGQQARELARQQKEDAKLEETFQEIRQWFETGKTKTEIYRKFNASSYPLRKKFIDQLFS